MTDDFTELEARLRHGQKVGVFGAKDLSEAADAIAALREERDQAVKALQAHYDAIMVDEIDDDALYEVLVLVRATLDRLAPPANGGDKP